MSNPEHPEHLVKGPYLQPCRAALARLCGGTRYDRIVRMKSETYRVILCSALAGAVSFLASAAERPVPRPALLERLNGDCDIYGIVHWNLNTYTDREWGFGDEDPALLNPSRFDANRIVRACADGGLKGLVVVAKHHDGFCLWPTKTTEHNISKSPFRGGRGDYVREMADACRANGVRFGVYVSPWDRNHPRYAGPEYVEAYHAQIRELLGGDYGEVFEMWFDNANGGDGYYGGAREKRKIVPGYYRFDEVFRFIRELQPKLCIFNEDDDADFRFGGTETGIVDPDSRSTGGHYDGVWEHYAKWANTGLRDGTTFHPIEADFPLRKNWFYHAADRGKTKSPEYLMRLYLSSVGNAATMNIGISPNREGLLDDEDVRALRGFTEIREAFFSREVTADGEPFNVVVMAEDVSRGEQVDAWRFLADGRTVLSGKSIGRRRIRVLDAPIAPKACELKIDADGGNLGRVTWRRYLADPALVARVKAATTDSGETDTAMWMTAASATSTDRRPYEFAWANRTQDEFPPVARLETADGWKVSATNAVARLETAKDRALFGESVARLVYSARVEGGSVMLTPPAPIACPTGFDTLSIWAYGYRVDAKDALTACFADPSGAAFEVPMGAIWHKEWHCVVAVLPPDRRHLTAKGATFVGFRFAPEKAAAERALDFTSFCVFRDPQRPLEPTPRAKRGVQVFPEQDQGHNVGSGKLPFPNRPETMTPPARDVKGLEFRLPAADAADWGELAFRVDGGAWIPLARNGGLYPRAAAKGVRTRFRREANSVIAEIVADPGVEEVRFGAMDLPRDGRLVMSPYYTLAWCDRWDIPGYEGGGVYLPKTAVFRVGGRTLCAGAMFDWTQSSASAPTDREDAGPGQLCCGVMYVPKTDRTRNRVFERFVWTVAEDFADTFPVVPNPDSPWKHVTGTKVWRPHAASDRKRDRHYWQTVRDAGMKHIVVTDHETEWRDGNESFTFRTHTAPKKGGDRGQYDYARFMIDTLGFTYGPYNNYTDFAPVNGFWSIDRVGRQWNGSLVPAWNRCYSPRSTWAVAMCEKLAPQVQKAFRFSTAYCDVHTAVTPWLRCDYDARSPGAATFAQVFYDYGEIMLLQKRTWGGPVYSEGGFHWWYAGLCDGSYAQDGTYGICDNPWLVDFDLCRIHDKCCNFGIGMPTMFYKWHNHAVDKPKDPNACLMRFLAATLAFGHPGYLAGPYSDRADANDIEDAKASYFLVQGVAAKYTQVSARTIEYAGADGRFRPTTEAVANGDWRRSQVRVTYADGTVVAVNGNKAETMPVEIGGVRRELPPNGWIVRSGDGTAGSENLTEDGVSVQRAWSAEYDFERRNGKNVKIEERK